MREIDKKQIWNFVYLMQMPLGMGPGEKMICDVNWETIYLLAKKHNVVTLGYEAARSYKGTDRPSPSLMEKWKMLSDQSTMQCLYQQAAQEELAEALEQAEIPFVFLKGAVLRDLYPRPDLRSMSDIDVLIHEEDAERVAGVMKELEYTVEYSGSRNEDVYCKEPAVTIEMHRKLFWKHEEWNKYFENVWNRSVLQEEKCCGYVMPLEDFYIHLLGHLVHHMINGGIGIKAFLDIELFRKKYLNIVRSQKMRILLEKFGFVQLEKNIAELLKYWKISEKSDDFMEKWTEYIVKCGAYGAMDNFIITNPAFENGNRKSKLFRLVYIYKRIFPTYSEMCYMYPKAQRGRYMYPWYWARRIMKNGVLRFSAIQKELLEIKKIDRKKIDDLNMLYEKIGILGMKE